MAEDSNSTAPGANSNAPDATAGGNNGNSHASSERGAAGASNGATKVTYGATITMSYKYDLMMGGDSARYATTIAKHHLLQLSKIAPITIRPRGNKEAEIICGTNEIAAKLSPVQREYKEYITIVYDKFVQNRGTCKCIIDVHTDLKTSDVLALWEPYLVKSDVRIQVITEKEVVQEEMRKAIWISGVQPRQCNKAVVKQIVEKLLSEKGKEMPIEVVDCYHALPVEVTENGVVSTQKIGTKVLAIKTRKEDIPVLVGNLSKMINQDKVNIFNDPSDLVGIANPHPVVHAIPFRASNRYQHILLSKHKKFMDVHQAPFFIREDIDRVIPSQTMTEYMKSYPQVAETDNTLRRILMSLTNGKGNQVAEAIYSTHRNDYIITCVQSDSKVIADFCELHALSFTNMWDKFDPNYESDLTKDMKALVEAINLEENGFYMAPGKTVAPSQIAPSAWSKKPKIVSTQSTTPAAIRAELKRTEDTLSNNLNSELQKISENHEQHIRAMEENHRHAMDAMTKKLDELSFYAQQQDEKLNALLIRNDNDQLQMTEGFEKIDKTITENEKSIELICQDYIKAVDTCGKSHRTVTRALQQSMETTAKSFKIIADEVTGIKSDIDELSIQADQMEESLDKSCEQVEFIFQKFEEQSLIQRGRDTNKNKRNRSRSASSTRSNISAATLRRSKKRQTPEVLVFDDDAMSSTGASLSHSDDENEMDGLDDVEEEEEEEGLNMTDLEDTEYEGDNSDNEMTQASNCEHASTLVSGSPQGEDSRK